LYGLPNFLHFWHLQIIISPQFGHGNLTAWVPGAIILWQLLHFGISMFDMNLRLSGFGFEYLEWLLIYAMLNGKLANEGRAHHA